MKKNEDQSQNIKIRKPEWSLKIIKADNGYILEGISYHPDEGDVMKVTSQMVLEEVEGDNSAHEVKLHQRLLWEVLEYFGASGSKHEDRIRVVIESPEGKIKNDE